MKRDIFQDASCAGLFQFAEKNRDLVSSNAMAAGLDVLRVNVSGCNNTQDLLAELGRALSFPNWYGTNFDALHDCLTDWDPRPQTASGHLLLISGLSTLSKGICDDLPTLIEVFRSAIEVRKQLSPPLWILIDTSFSGVESLSA